ncbi:ABC transporter substrate-binding protein [Paenibacillus silvisoli]|uniref:ABC transporter substrate-binding protein n=1 Tax=Paenibacillus silvisoli TaxID=3110539 RepID=UPI002804F72E|nr:ABC transporter substrate-binding protein [Paenibacillus silvisoli]
MHASSRKRWKIASQLAVLLSLSVMVSACGGNGGNNAGTNGESADSNAAESTNATNAANEPAANATEETVDLVWYFPGPPQKDLAAVQDAVNAYTKEKINATVQLKSIDFGGYDQKMNTVLAANENFDIAWSSGSWLLPYMPNARKGAFLAIDDLLEQRPKLKETMPQVMWDNVKVDGKTYAIPNYQTITTREGFVIQKRFADKYNLDVSTIKGYKDIEPFLEQIKQNEKGIIPFGGIANFSSYFYGFWETAAGLVKKDDTAFHATPMSDVAEYKQHLDIVHDWYVKGYSPKDVAIAKWDELKAKGVVAVSYSNVLKPGGEVESAKKNGENEIIYVPITDPYIASDTNGTLNAISKTSQHPEKALEFLELVNTDPVLYNLLCFGIEGKHYKNENGVAVPIADSGYDPVTDWVFGNQFNALLRPGQDPKTWETTKEWNNTDKVSPFIGFSYDTAPVKTEIANMDAVIKEFSDALNSGTLDPAKYLPEFNDKLKKAGAEKVQEVRQTALDAFVQQKGLK